MCQLLIWKRKTPFIHSLVLSNTFRENDRSRLMSLLGLSIALVFPKTSKVQCIFLEFKKKYVNWFNNTFTYAAFLSRCEKNYFQQ